MHRSLTTRIGLVVVVGFLLSAVPVLAEGDCRAELDASLRGTQEGKADTKYRFAVEVKAYGEACAWVDYELVTTQEDADGNKKTYSVAKRIKLRGETKARVENYAVRSTSTLLDWKFNVVKCTTCNP
jgi:hypothetical protein